MPIKSENKDRYPDTWHLVRRRILHRANNRCEICGAVNYQSHPETGARVILTIMHLDHTPENCADENLLAACQKCHNSYDAEHRKKTRHAGQYGDGNRQLELQEFPK